MEKALNIKSLFVFCMVFAAILSIISSQPVKAGHWLFYVDEDIDDSLVYMNNYEYGGVNNEYEWRYQIQEESSYELPEDVYDELWVSAAC